MVDVVLGVPWTRLVLQAGEFRNIHLLTIIVTIFYNQYVTDSFLVKTKVD